MQLPAPPAPSAETRQAKGVSAGEWQKEGLALIDVVLAEFCSQREFRSGFVLKHNRFQRDGTQYLHLLSTCEWCRRSESAPESLVELGEDRRSDNRLRTLNEDCKLQKTTQSTEYTLHPSCVLSDLFRFVRTALPNIPSLQRPSEPHICFICTSADATHIGRTRHAYHSSCHLTHHNSPSCWDC